MIPEVINLRTDNATVIKKSTKRHNGRQSTKQKAEIAFDLYRFEIYVINLGRRFSSSYLIEIPKEH
jgi:hypothetical protein